MCRYPTGREIIPPQSGDEFFALRRRAITIAPRLFLEGRALINQCLHKHADSILMQSNDNSCPHPSNASPAVSVRGPVDHNHTARQRSHSATSVPSWVVDGPEEDDHACFKVYNDALPALQQPQTPRNLPEARHQSRISGSQTTPGKSRTKESRARLFDAQRARSGRWPSPPPAT